MKNTEIKDVEISARDRLVMDLRPYLGDLEYNRVVFIQEIKGFYRMGVRASFEIGRRLLCLKEMEGHGSFGEILENLGIDHYRACEFMLMAKKFGIKFAESANFDKIEMLGKSKALLAASLSPDYIEEMKEKDEIAGIPLDEIKAMSYSELRNMVKDLKRQNENGQKQNRRLREKIDKLEKEQEGLDLASVDGVKKWVDKVFGKLNEIHNLMNDGNAPKAEVFEGDNGPACQSQLRPIDVMLLKISRNYEELKGNWGVE